MAELRIDHFEAQLNMAFLRAPSSPSIDLPSQPHHTFGGKVVNSSYKPSATNMVGTSLHVMGA